MEEMQQCVSYLLAAALVMSASIRFCFLSMFKLFALEIVGFSSSLLCMWTVNFNVEVLCTYKIAQ